MAARLLLVVPCHDEAGRLNPDAFLTLVRTEPETAILFVDDGSTDRTLSMLRDTAAQADGAIDVLVLATNVGKARAVQAGMLAAFERGPDFAGFWDADLSTPLSEVSRFLDVLRSNPSVDIVMGARVKLLGRRIRRNVWRHYAGRVFATAASLLLGLPVYDTQCGAKLFRNTPEVRRAFLRPFESKWVFDVEILSRYVAAVGRERAEAAICEVPLQSWTDVPGSKLTLAQALGAAWDLVRVARPQSRD